MAALTALFFFPLTDVYSIAAASSIVRQDSAGAGATVNKCVKAPS